jgi:alpha-L-rhamnosidase
VPALPSIDVLLTCPLLLPKKGRHFGNNSCNDIAWTSAYPQIAAMLYQYYGDTKTLERRYSSLVRYIENLISHSYNATSNAHAGLAVCDKFGDWLCGNAQSCCAVRGSPSCPVGAEMAGFSYVLALRSMSKIAAVLGNSTAAAHYEALASSATQEFHAYFFNASVGRYGGDEGAIQSLSLPALEIGSPPASVYPDVVKTVGNDMKAIDYTMAVGAVTSKIVFNVLSEHGMHEAALRAAINTDEPSIGHWWKRWNATTCYEAFPGSPLTNQTGSLNHIFLCGGIGHWMWKHLVGLTPAAPAFAQVSLIPRIHDSVGPRSVGGEFLSPQGRIRSSWTLTDAGIVSLSVSLPVGVSGATIVVPKPTIGGKPSVKATVKLGGAVIWDGSRLLGEPAGVVGAMDQRHGVSFRTTNGVFEFESAAKSPDRPA